MSHSDTWTSGTFLCSSTAHEPARRPRGRLHKDPICQAGAQPYRNLLSTYSACARAQIKSLHGGAEADPTSDSTFAKLASS